MTDNTRAADIAYPDWWRVPPRAADVTLSVTMSRALTDCTPFGEYWGPGPIAASYWVIAPSGVYIIVKASAKSRAARVVGNTHSHRGSEWCNCTFSVKTPRSHALP